MNRELMEANTEKKFSKVHRIAFNSANYKFKEEMFQAVATMLKILTENNYVCSFEYEDCGIYVLKFDHDNLGCAEFALKWIEVEP